MHRGGQSGRRKPGFERKQIPMHPPSLRVVSCSVHLLMSWLLRTTLCSSGHAWCCIYLIRLPGAQCLGVRDQLDLKL